MKNKLLPCPLCGGEATSKHIQQPFPHGNVGCKACGLYIQWKVSPAGAVAKWNRRTAVKTGVFDLEEIYPDCTVQVLKNTDTGETSVGWWKNDSPPAGMEDNDEQ